MTVKGQKFFRLIENTRQKPKLYKGIQQMLKHGRLDDELSDLEKRS